MSKKTIKNSSFTILFVLLFGIAHAKTLKPEFRYNTVFLDRFIHEKTVLPSLNRSNKKTTYDDRFYVADANEDKQKAPSANSGKPNAEVLAKKAANPISDLWLIWTQNDTGLYTGDLVDGSKTLNSFKLQPVMPVPIKGGDWNFLIRPVFQFQSVPLDDDAGDLLGVSLDTIVTDENLRSIAADPSGRTNGLGDTALLTIAGPNKVDGFVWAVGASQLFPTASDEVLGQEKWQAGPAFLVANFGKKPGDWNLGLLAQHWWSYAGTSKRGHTDLTDIQYFINYKASPTALIGMAPNIKINHAAEDSDDRWTIPIGLGYNDLSFIGKLPFRYGVEIQKTIVQPDNAGLDWNLRFYFIPIIKNPFKPN